MKFKEIKKTVKTVRRYYKMTIRNNSYGSEATIKLGTLEEVEEHIQYCDIVGEEIIKIECIKEVKEIQQFEF